MRSIPFSGIPSRLLGLALVVSLPLLVLSLTLFRGAVAEGVAEAEREPFAHAEMIAHEVDEHVSNLEVVIRSLAAATSTEPRDTARNDAIAARVEAAEAAHARPAIGNFNLWSLSGDNIGRSRGRETDPRANIAGTRQFRRAAAGERGFGEPVRLAGEWSADLAVPIKGSGGGVAGVATVSIGLSDLANRVMTAEVVPAGWLGAVVNEDGTVVVRTEPAGDWIGRPASELPGASEALRDTGRTHRVTAGGQFQLANATAVGLVPWKVLVVAPEESAYASVRAMRRRALVVVAVALALGVAAVWLTARQMIAPLRALTAQASAIAAGGLAQRAPADLGGEFGDLARAFDYMAQTIETRTSALDTSEALARQDLTDLRAAQQALASSEERLRQAVRVAQIGIYDLDERTGALYWSDPLRSQFGYGAEEPATVDGFLARVHPDDRGAVDAAVVRARDEDSGGAFDADYRIVRTDSSVRWVSNRGRTFFEGEGSERVAVRTIGAVVDITELHAAEEAKAALQAQLMHAQRLETVGRLAGGVAHDFNNMLHVILAFVELLRRSLPAEGVTLRYVGEIERAAERSRDITRQLLSFSRRQVVSPVPCNLNALIATAQEGLVRLIGEDIHLRCVPQPEIWTVQADSAQVEQVLMNLVVNSRDAMPKGGLLTIETANVRLDDAYVRGHYGTKVGDYVLLAVSDNGIGMDKETLAHVFEPFFTTKPLGMGTGLGLATTYGIVDQAGGFINVYSEPGHGTTFKVYLPRAVASQAQPLHRPAEPSLEIRGRVVLVVEDEELVRRATTETLEALGFRVLAASDAAQAIAICEKDQPVIDVVLTDVVMPGMNGRDLHERLQKLRPGLRVLFTSGYTASVIAHHGMLEAGIHFIPKPFGIGELAHKLRDVLATRSGPPLF